MGLPNNDTTCKIFAFENRSYLGKFEAEFKKALARESGALGGYCLMKKIEGRKSRDTVPLKIFLKERYFLSDDGRDRVAGRQGEVGVNLGLLQAESGAQLLNYLRQKASGAFNTRPGIPFQIIS
jgi:hypothetical protein